MINRIRGEKNSIKRTIIHYGLCFILVALSISAMVLFHYNIAVQQYDKILQNVVLVDGSKDLVEQMKRSTQKFADTREWRDYEQIQAGQKTLRENLDLLSGICKNPTSQLAIQSIFSLLELSDDQLNCLALGDRECAETAGLLEHDEQILYLLNRVQNLEVTRAAEVYPQLSQHMTALTRVSVIMLILIFLTTIASFFSLCAQIYTPLRHLVDNVREISKGNFDEPDIEVTGHDELNYVASAVNEMKKDLSHLISAREEKLEMEKRLKEAQFHALQTQVNPHFLFNVLSVATAKALTEGADETLDVVESISYMLRYSLQSMKADVTLRDEMKMVQVYLFLQHQRFGNRQKFTIEVDDTVLDVRVPGMTVQPIVENAIIHGCDLMEEGGWVEVRCKADDHRQYAVVSVENNGGVLSAAQMQAFHEGRDIPHGGKTSGIGLGNVRDRMRGFYDCPDLMDCAVTERNTTVVTMRYPMDERKS